MNLWINDSGAATNEIERGVAAAKAVFDRAGATAEQAFAAQQKQCDDEPLNDAELVRADAWREADSAAVLACCEGWARIPESALLVLQ